MEDFYEKVEIKIKEQNGDKFIGIFVREFENVTVSFIGNSILINKIDKKEDIENQIVNVFSLDNVINFKTKKKC